MLYFSSISANFILTYLNFFQVYHSFFKVGCDTQIQKSEKSQQELIESKVYIKLFCFLHCYYYV